MVKQYPHIINWSNLSGGGFDEDGMPIEGSETPVESKGRYESFRSPGKQISMPDGETLLATGAVYFPKRATYPPRQTVITIPFFDNLKAEVLHAYTGQLNTTVFIKEIL